MPARLSPRAATLYQRLADIGLREGIRAAWLATGSSGRATADLLGVSPSTLYREIERLGLARDLPGFRADSATVA